MLDLTSGDGALALAAYKKGICYTGLVFSDAHKRYLAQHLERSIFRAMSDDAGPLYDPRLVAALVEDSAAPTQATPKPKAKPKKPTAKPAAKPEATPAGKKPSKHAACDDDAEQDPVGDEGDADGGGCPPVLRREVALRLGALGLRYLPRLMGSGCTAKPRTGACGS